MEARGGAPEDVRVLCALRNIFSAFAQPRPDLLQAAEPGGATPTGVSPSASAAHLPNGAHFSPPLRMHPCVHYACFTWCQMGRSCLLVGRAIAARTVRE